jgi:hypothetical protein
VSLYYRGLFHIQTQKIGQDLFFTPLYHSIPPYPTTLLHYSIVLYDSIAMDLDQIDDILLLLAAREQQQKRRVQTGQPGQEYIRELLDSGHPARIFHVLRMQLATFYTLRDWLAINTDLKGSNVTSNQRVRGWGKEVSIEEKLIIFIHITSKGASIRDTAERFSRSKDTISKLV